MTIRKRWPKVAILVLSQYVEERYATGCWPTAAAPSAIC